jgi:glutamine amidotransferase
MKSVIGIINYKAGNTQSVKNAVDKLDLTSKVCHRPSDLNDCTHIILPGVGSYDVTMENLINLGFIESLQENVIKKEKPFLGICVGFQILFEGSIENKKTNGLRWLEGSCTSLSKIDKKIISPHSGWNEVLEFEDMNLLKKDPHTDNYFYFLHSFLIKNIKKKNGLKFSKTIYQGIEFVSCIELNNIYGCQFHPEKSQNNGQLYLKNFCEL